MESKEVSPEVFLKGEIEGTETVENPASIQDNVEGISEVAEPEIAEVDPLSTEEKSSENENKTPEKGSTENERSAKENDEILKIKINRKTSVHVNKSNFVLDKTSDTVNVIDEKAFMQELNIKCNNKTDRATKINEMRTKALDKIKEELKDKQRERSNSVKRRPEDEIDDASYKPPKAQRNSSSSKNNDSPIKSPSKNSMNPSLSPKKLGIIGSLKSSLQGKEPSLLDFRGINHSLIPTPASKNRQ